jgi:hypothetical protein
MIFDLRFWVLDSLGVSSLSPVEIFNDRRQSPQRAAEEIESAVFRGVAVAFRIDHDKRLIEQTPDFLHGCVLSNRGLWGLRSSAYGLSPMA